MFLQSQCSPELLICNALQKTFVLIFKIHFIYSLVYEKHFLQTSTFVTWMLMVSITKCIYIDQLNDITAASRQIFLLKVWMSTILELNHFCNFSEIHFFWPNLNLLFWFNNFTPFSGLWGYMLRVYFLLSIVKLAVHLPISWHNHLFLNLFDYLNPTSCFHKYIFGNKPELLRSRAQ